MALKAPKELQKQFTKAIQSIGPHRHRHEAFSDFLEMAYCAVRKPITTGAEADALEVSGSPYERCR
jgi:hypothetical protein